MKTVLECYDGELYLFNHPADMHKAMIFRGPRVPQKTFAIECNIADLGENWHAVIDGAIEQ